LIYPSASFLSTYPPCSTSCLTSFSVVPYFIRELARSMYQYTNSILS
jgi:hypothetical protein